MELKGKVVLITGAATGIGKDTAIEFSKKKSKVAICYHKSPGDEVVNECQSHNEAMLVHLDVTDIDSINHAIEEVVNRFGRIDILVNNAAVLVYKPFEEQTLEEIKSQIDVNLIGVMHVTHCALPHMKKLPEAMMINVASIVGIDAYGGGVPYGASKFGLRGFAKSLAPELGNIRVYIVNPGLTCTKMSEYAGAGVDPSMVADIVIRTAEETLSKETGDDIVVPEYLENTSS